MRKNVIWMLLAIGAVAMGACSDGNDEAERAQDQFVPGSGYTTSNYEYWGHWVLAGKPYGSGSVKVSNGMATFTNMPCWAFVNLVVPQTNREEAIQHIESGDYTMKYKEVGVSATSFYGAMEEKDYMFTTVYGGATHEITLVMSGEGVAVGDFKLAGATFVFSIGSIEIDGEQTMSYPYSPLNLTLFYDTAVN